MAKSKNEYLRERIAAGRLLCDCGEKATRINDGQGECERCYELNRKVGLWHDKTWLMQQGQQELYAT